jgi:hypothetical protein
MATDNFSFAENKFGKKRLIEKTQSIFLKLINFIKATHIYKNKKKKGLILFQYSVLNGMLIYIYICTLHYLLTLLLTSYHGNHCIHIYRYFGEAYFRR